MKHTLSQDQSLFEAISALSPDSSKSTIRSWLKDGRIAVDGQICKIGSTLLNKGQTLELIKKKIMIEEDIEILYQDNHLVVIVKPEGLLSVSTDYEKERTAHKILKRQLHPKKVEVVHRLDQDTSGVMLFALDQRTQELLKDIFEKHAIDRQYTAIVEGRLTDIKGTWSSYLSEDDNYFVHSYSNPEKGKLAVTHFEVTGKSKKYTRLNLKLETGKKNQIRVHCSEAGHPVAGDAKYGAVTNPASRLCLHATTLGFTHPIKKKKMKFSARIPKSFDSIVKSQS
jgi:23S rRNA pseudouridine1911/1915/1917 synthase